MRKYNKIKGCKFQLKPQYKSKVNKDFSGEIVYEKWYPLELEVSCVAKDFLNKPHYCSESIINPDSRATRYLTYYQLRRYYEKV